MDRGIGGAIVGPSAYFMKSPPHQFPDHVALNLTREFIAAQATGKPEPAASARTEALHEDEVHHGAPRHVRAH
jgi:myo-inositol-1-phosphate synthase